jgi:hypothetical protein
VIAAYMLGLSIATAASQAAKWSVGLPYLAYHRNEHKGVQRVPLRAAGGYPVSWLGAWEPRKS